MEDEIKRKSKQLDVLFEKMRNRKPLSQAKKTELDKLFAARSTKSFKELAPEITRVTQELQFLNGENAKDLKEIDALLEEINTLRKKKRSQNTLPDAVSTGQKKAATPLTRAETKALMNKEKDWAVLKTEAMEDLYSVRHLKGKQTGIACYAVMMGGTVLSVHLNLKDALENYHARLNDEVSGMVDGWDFDDF
jgi:hypothetical protein